MKPRPIPLTRPPVSPEDIAAAVGVLESGQLVQGVVNDRFEALLALRAGRSFAITCSSGTAALHLVLLALGCGPGDEVLIPDFTYPATGNAVALTGARPVLVDVCPRTFAMDPADLARKIGSASRAVVPVDPFGLPHDYDKIGRLADDAGLFVLEDAACALGASLDGRPAGTLGHAAAFSFHPRKIITTGEGGAVVTDDPDLAATVRALRNHGLDSQDGPPTFARIGLNYRLSDFQAAVGLSQLERLDDIIGDRRAAAQTSRAALRDTGLILQEVPAGREHTFQSLVGVLPDCVTRATFLASLRSQGVEATIGTYALHKQPSFQALGSVPDEGLPNSALLGEQAVTLPLFGGMAESDIARTATAVIHAIRTSLTNSSAI